MADGKAKIVGRHQRVAFMNVATGEEAANYQRMTGFTQVSNAKNPKEYNRRYVDKATDDTDVVGYAPSIEYSFDRHTNTPVHERIAKVHDGELVGSALVDIVTVDLFSADDKGTCVARKRTCAIIPGADGDGTDALIYTGSLKSKSEIEEGTATLSEDGKTATYVAPTSV